MPLQEVVWEDVNPDGHDPYFTFRTLMGPFLPSLHLSRLTLKDVWLHQRFYSSEDFLADVASLRGLRYPFCSSKRYCLHGCVATGLGQRDK